MTSLCQTRNSLLIAPVSSAARRSSPTRPVSGTAMRASARASATTPGSSRLRRGAPATPAASTRPLSISTPATSSELGSVPSARSVGGRERATTTSARGPSPGLRIMRDFGLTPEQYAVLVARQEGRCGICGTTEPATASSSCPSITITSPVLSGDCSAPPVTTASATSRTTRGYSGPPSPTWR